MRTYNEIKQALTQQNLAGMCTCDTQAQYDFFINLVKVEKIEQRVNKLIPYSNGKRCALYYILYDTITDEFSLNISFISRINNEIICEEELDAVAKWIKTTEGYILEQESIYQITKNKMVHLLPKIHKSPIEYVCGGTIPEGIAGFVYGKYADDVGGYYYTKLSNNPQPPCCSELQLENCGGTYPDTGICVQSGCCVDNISVC